MTEAVDMKIEQKPKPKQVIFSFIDNWKNIIHYVERWLDVSLIVEPEGMRLEASEDQVNEVFAEISTNEDVIQKLNLREPWASAPRTSVDVTRLSVLAAHDGRVKIVSLAVDENI